MRCATGIITRLRCRRMRAQRCGTAPKCWWTDLGVSNGRLTTRSCEMQNEFRHRRFIQHRHRYCSASSPPSAEGAKWKARWLLSENYGCWTSVSAEVRKSRRRRSQRLSGNVKGLGWVQRTDKGSSESSFARLLITNESFYIPLIRGGFSWLCSWGIVDSGI